MIDFWRNLQDGALVLLVAVGILAMAASVCLIVMMAVNSGWWPWLLSGTIAVIPTAWLIGRYMNR